MSEFDVWQRRCDNALEAMNQVIRERDAALLKLKRVNDALDAYPVANQEALAVIKLVKYALELTS